MNGMDIAERCTEKGGEFGFRLQVGGEPVIPYP